MPPGMPDTSVMHIAQCTCGEICVHAFCTCLVSCSKLGTVCNSLALSCIIAQRFLVELASVPFFGQTSRTHKKRRLLQHQFCAFLVVRREIPSDMEFPCAHEFPSDMSFLTVYDSVVSMYLKYRHDQGLLPLCLKLPKSTARCPGTRSAGPTQMHCHNSTSPESVTPITTCQASPRLEPRVTWTRPDSPPTRRGLRAYAAAARSTTAAAQRGDGSRGRGGGARGRRGRPFHSGTESVRQRCRSYRRALLRRSAARYSAGSPPRRAVEPPRCGAVPSHSPPGGSLEWSELAAFARPALSSPALARPARARLVRRPPRLESPASPEFPSR